jgi:hypothetical protein
MRRSKIPDPSLAREINCNSQDRSLPSENLCRQLRPTNGVRRTYARLPHCRHYQDVSRIAAPIENAVVDALSAGESARIWSARELNTPQILIRTDSWRVQFTLLPRFVKFFSETSASCSARSCT